MKHHGFYPFPGQHGNHQHIELNFETKLPQTHNIEKRIQELENQTGSSRCLTRELCS